MKKTIFFFLLVLLYFSVCNAEAIYDTSERNINGTTYYEGYVLDRFDEANIILQIGKVGFDGIVGEPRMYFYKINIVQAAPATINVKELTLMSEIDSITIPEQFFKNKHRQSGTDLTVDTIGYNGDPGRVNVVIDSIVNKMIIKIKTTNNKIYTLHPSQDFIAGLKRVAKWS